MKRRLGSIALILLLAFVVLPGAAQDATPMVDAPDPELCTLRPLTVADLQRIAEIVVEPRPTVTPVAEPFAMPEGEELFTSERKEVEKDIRR
ncbi:MAG: hypothetical protein KC438_15890, partial [Thermomicrobiales bacterium]|nr:hypothetical protein [Thermomicrobiales bacterium]